MAHVVRQDQTINILVRGVVSWAYFLARLVPITTYYTTSILCTSVIVVGNHDRASEVCVGRAWWLHSQ